MFTRRFALLLVAVFLSSPLTAWAHRHKAGALLGYRQVERSSLKGLGMSFDIPLSCRELMLEKPREKQEHGQDDEQQTEQGEKKEAPSFLPLCKKSSPFSLVFSGFGAAGDHDGGTLSQFEFVTGLRLSLNKAERVQPFVHVLGGRGHESFSGSAERDPSNQWWTTGTVGGGLDFVLEDRVAGEWVLRGQYDRTVIWADEGTKWFGQFAFSFGYRWN